MDVNLAGLADGDQLADPRMPVHPGDELAQPWGLSGTVDQRDQLPLEGRFQPAEVGQHRRQQRHA